jgi:hypothetical protein
MRQDQEETVRQSVHAAIRIKRNLPQNVAVWQPCRRMPTRRKRSRDATFAKFNGKARQRQRRVEVKLKSPSTLSRRASIVADRIESVSFIVSRSRAQRALQT